MIEVNLNCESDTRPCKYVIENILNGKCEIIINDEIKKVQENIVDESGKETKREKYIFNSYRISTNYRDNLEEELKTDASYKKWVLYLNEQYYNDKAQEIRNIRNELLKETDSEMCLDRMGLEMPDGTSFTAWVNFLKSMGNAVTGEMAKYRQELRDITKQEGFPFNVVFPTKPSTKEEREVK